MRSVRTLLSQGRSLSILILVLGLLLVDSLGEDLIFHPEWGFDSYEIIIPKKLSSRGGEEAVAKHVSYLLQVKGKEHVLHLWPKRLLLSRNLQVFSFTEEGDLLEDYPYIPGDCNYMGFIEGTRDSEATLSTCLGGLQGILKIDAKHYQIEPLKASSSFEHVIYLLKKEEEFHNQSCGLLDDEIKRQMAQHENVARLRDFSDSYKHKKYLELALVFDHRRYLYSNSNLTRVINDAILMTGIMDTYFQDINMRIHLRGIEVWTDANKMKVDSPTTQQVLSQFLLYRRRTLNARIPADWAHLYLKGQYVDYLGQSFGRVCSQTYSGAISVFPDINVLGPATWSAHCLGHGVGMSHDYEYCQCKGRRSCIMGTGRTGFSNCSYSYYIAFIHSAGACLTDIPEVGYVVQRCGNKIVEENEECDCGSREDCKKDQCCQPDCKLKHGVNCSMGLCCHKCHFRPSGYVCRKEENECDLAEYCTGTSGLCPSDTYKQDGTPCKYEARCFRKGCQSRYMQCQRLFGPDAREAPSKCYDAVNLIGDQHGNCGIRGIGDYQKCTRENAVCGRLQCINVKTIPEMPEHTTIISTHLGEENLMCWGTGYHLSKVPLGIPDIGVVNDGTSCGTNRICVNRTCVDSSLLQFDCLPEKCNHRGICNNKKNCHCLYGWAPPFCEEVGYGGSVDSGPPGPLKARVPTLLQVVLIMLTRISLFAISVIIVYLK
ncbi:disintegrin and metalloproteinase domain-containing protein 30 [Equus caballus]|uniref:disintegrin and metalloproteinase domain-containing protein 30 n=1 Tax=Equus caballus TaxID=9796 RepID=UPI000717BCCD